MIILEQLLSSHKAVQKCQNIRVGFCLDFHALKTQLSFISVCRTMEGKETSPSHTSESSILDLPSVCDLAEHFLPPHSSENSEELYPSGDVFPSPPTGNSFCFSTCSFFSQCFINVGSVARLSHCRLVLVHLPVINHSFTGIQPDPAGQIQWEPWVDGTQERSSEGAVTC